MSGTTTITPQEEQLSARPKTSTVRDYAAESANSACEKALDIYISYRYISTGYNSDCYQSHSR